MPPWQFKSCEAFFFNCANSWNPWNPWQLIFATGENAYFYFGAYVLRLWKYSSLS